MHDVIKKMYVMMKNCIMTSKARGVAICVIFSCYVINLAPLRMISIDLCVTPQNEISLLAALQLKAEENMGMPTM